MSKIFAFENKIGKLKQSWKTAFISAIIIGLITHMYKFTNTLLNHDALFHLYSANNTVTSGRWFLAVACAPSSLFDLPWINGLLALFWMGLTAAVLVDYFDIDSKPVIILSSGIIVTFPSIVNTFTFEYTADGYMLAMLLAALAARLSMVGQNKISRLLLAALCICLSCGIYQAYLSFALLMALCHFMTELLKGNRENRDYYRWILNQIFVYAFGLIAYLVLWKLCMSVQGVSAVSYKGIDQLGNQPFSLGSIVLCLINALRTTAYFFLSRNVFIYGWSIYAVLNVLFLASLAALIVAAITVSKLYKQPARLLLFVLCLAAIPVFACIWCFISVDMEYHLVMLQSFSILYVFSMVLASHFFKPRYKQLLCLLMTVLVFKFGVQANQVYFEMNHTMEKSRATGIEMMTRIHMLDDGSIEKIALIGSVERSLVDIGWSMHDEIWVYAHQIRPNLVYDNSYGNLFLSEMLDSTYLPVTENELNYLSDTEFVRDMPVWPLNGSVAVIDGTVIVKLSESND